MPTDYDPIAEQALNELESGWARLGVDIDAYLNSSNEELHLSRIVVQKEMRGQGVGTKAMEDLTKLADHLGYMMTLSPATDFGATSLDRLKRFYRRFGFISNKGRNKRWEIYHTMYRPARNG